MFFVHYVSNKRLLLANIEFLLKLNYNSILGYTSE